MATLCKNCGAPLVFDPAKQQVVCNTCGSSWYADEIESSDKEFAEQKKAVSMGQTFDPSVAKEFLDCYIYTCSSCGGEIILNGTEASTKCIYCGSSSVVFNRISKEKSPEFIIPFSITKDEAVDLIRKQMNGKILIPKEIKNFEPSAVRGIYIPYWIVNANHYEADVIRGSVKSGKNSVTRYFTRGGTLSVKNLPVDASLMLSDESSQRLEPFDMKKLKPFDEDYLLGFYSNVSDITNQDLQEAVNKRCSDAFQEKAKQDVMASNKSIPLSRSATQIDRDVIYAMLPVWFITFDYEGKHNTIMVNGDTGKVVAGLPWKKRTFYSLIGIFGTLMTLLLTAIIYNTIMPNLIYRRIYTLNGTRSIFYSNNVLFLLIMTLVIWLVVLIFGYANMKKVTEQLDRTQSSSIFNFMKKRQG